MARSNAQASRIREPSRVPAWVWLFTGVVLGAFIMFLIHLSEFESPEKATQDSVGVTEKTDVQKPRFDFYDLLKETYIPATQPDTSDSNQTAPVPEQEFLLQVASFRSPQDADQLRAELLLLNLDAYTENTKVYGETWHRVLVGPFSSKSKLAKARSTLLSNRHEALVLKRSPQG